MDVKRWGRRLRWRDRVRLLAVITAGSLVAAACGGGGGDDDDATGGDRGDAGGRDEPATEERATDERADDVLDNPQWRNVVLGPADRASEPVEGGSVVVALEGESNTYLPSNFQGTQGSFNVVFAIFDPLVSRDADGQLRPYLAESIEPNDDFTEWTLRLRPDVRFHDGTPLNADALKRNFDDYLMAEGAITGATLGRVIERMETVDELTVKYVLTRPEPQFPERLELPAGWPFSPDAADRAGEAFGEQPVGTGPFRFVRWDRDNELVVERNPDYWQEGQPYLDEITFRPIPDEAIRAAALASGDVDAAQSTRLSSFVAEVADLDDVEIALGLGNSGSGVLFNTDGPPTDDVRIRQALAHAVDQEALIQVVAGEAAELSEARTQFFPQGSPLYSDEVADAWPRHDLARAEQLYQDYVDDPERSDGKSPGEPVSLTVNTTNIPNLVEQAMAYEGFFEDVGFDVTVEPLEQTVSITKAVTRDYQVLAFRKGDNRSPLGEFLFYFDDPEEVLSNFTGFHDETVARVIAELRTTDDLDEQAALTEELGLHLAEEMPWYWTGTDLALVAADRDVQGVRSWTFPDGTLGDGTLAGVTFWGQAWRNGGG